MNTLIKNIFLQLILSIFLFLSLSHAQESNCIDNNDTLLFEQDIKDLRQAIDKENLQAISSFINFPITDNHNHVITRRVFLEEQTYTPVANVMVLLKEHFPKHLKDQRTFGRIKPTQCQKYLLTRYFSNEIKGVKFVFKKIGFDLKLKLIRNEIKDR